MKYKAEQKITNQALTETTIKEEQLFREVAFSIVKELPIDKLKQLFNLKVVYAFEEDLEKAYKENNPKKEIFNMLENGGAISDGKIFESLLTLKQK